MTATIDWVHPSVRDLVIDHLMAHRADRIDFLEKASPEGLVLALSVAGGSRGERELPLLQTAEDWAAVGKGLLQEVGGASPDGVYRLLSSLAAAARTVPPATAERAALETVAGSVLEATQTVWEQANDVIQIDALRIWLRLSQSVFPLARVPDLRRTWLRSAGAAEVLTQGVEVPVTEEELSRLQEWLELAVLIKQNEPRFLRAQRFYDDFAKPLVGVVEQTEAFLSEIGTPVDSTDVDGAPFGISTEEEREVGQLRVLVSIAEQIGALLPLHLETAEDVASRCEMAIDDRQELERSREQWLEERGAEQADGWQDDGDPPEPLEAFVIEALFADL